ncbi:MAG TPA: nucleoside 2-deoxyribosyltransferase domain-containing protein [Pirellulales bacterium]|nr:nucleoside 2-deoxyribosyltransferase domain-containing protein [Pirellulales bacterium]
MRIFLAGIMQGSHLASAIHNQDYRARIKQLLTEHLTGAAVYDPLADHANSLDYDDTRGREVFFRHNQMSAEVDVLVAFVPEASMGTAIEMWQAYRSGNVVITISPLVLNWTVRFLSHEIYATVEDFAAALQCGALARRLSELIAERRQAIPSRGEQAS